MAASSGRGVHVSSNVTGAATPAAMVATCWFAPVIEQLARGVEVDGHTLTTAHPDEIDIYDCINLPPPVVGEEEVDEEDLVSTGPAGGPPHPRSSLLEPGEAQEPTHLIRQ